HGGGWSWYLHGQPDSNDTAAAIEALRAAGVGGTPVRRGLAYLVRLRNADGGFELTPGRGSDAQSTARAIQAFGAARKPGPPAAPAGAPAPRGGSCRRRCGGPRGCPRRSPAGRPRSGADPAGPRTPQPPIPDELLGAPSPPPRKPARQLGFGREHGRLHGRDE